MAENEKTLSRLAKEGAPRLTMLIDEAFSLKDIDLKCRNALVNQLFERLIPIDAAEAARLAWKHLPSRGGEHRHHRYLSPALNAWASTACLKQP